MKQHIQLDTLDRILVQRADRLGDVIFSLPVIHAIKKAAPNIRIDFLTSGIGKKFLDGHPLIDKVISFDHDQQRSYTAFANLVSDLKSSQYDAYLSLWNHPQLARIARHCDIPISVGTPLALF